MSIMVDDVLRVLCDGRWHSLGELSTELRVSRAAITRVVEFHRSFGFIQFDAAEDRVLIDGKIRDFLVQDL
jgi:biotin operon repressor